MKGESSTMAGAKPNEGPSNNSKPGRAISARPIAAICCSPPDSAPSFSVDAKT